MSKRYHTIDCNNVVKSYLSGVTVKNIAAQFSVSEHVIYDILKRASIAPDRNRNIIPPSKADILALYNSGTGVAGIADQLGFTRGHMIRFFKKYNIPMRSRRDQQIERMKNATEEQIKFLTKNAHLASKGRKHTFEEKCKRARTRYANQSFQDSKYEALLSGAFRDNGIDFVREYPVGPYNLDFLVGNIAVEIFGGHFHSSGHHNAIFHERTKYILNSGFSIIFAFANRDSFESVIANKIMILLNIFRSDEAGIAKYRVIWGTPDRLTGGSAYDDNFPLVCPTTHIRDVRTGRYKSIPK